MYHYENGNHGIDINVLKSFFQLDDKNIKNFQKVKEEIKNTLKE